MKKNERRQSHIASPMGIANNNNTETGSRSPCLRSRSGSPEDEKLYAGQNLGGKKKK